MCSLGERPSGAKYADHHGWGSAVLTLEPVAPGREEDEALFEGGDDLSLANVHAMVVALATGRRVDRAVADSLDSARRALGGETSAIEITLPARLEAPSLTLDQDRIERTREDNSAVSAASTVSGWLHALDLEPDRIGVRSPQGIDWTCTYPEGLEEQVKALMDEVVVVEGERELRSPTRRRSSSNDSQEMAWR